MTKEIFAGLFVLLLAGCRSKYGIHKSYGFTRQMTAGTIPVDQNGQPLAKGVQTVHLLYIQTDAGAAKPAWDSAWVNGVPYRVEPIKITQDRVMLGQPKAGGEEIILRPAPGKTLWQLMLTPPAAATGLTEGETAAPDFVRLTGPWKNKRVDYTVNVEAELAPFFGQ